MPARGVVFLSEDEESLGGERFFCGTFSGYHDDHAGGVEEIAHATAEEAIAWGRARAGHVWIRHAASSAYCAVGARREAADPSWPPPDLPRLIRRRPPAEQWRDRPADATPIPWTVTVGLAPPRPERTPDFDLVVEELAARVGGRWNAGPLEARIADIERRQPASVAADRGWVSYHPAAYLLTVEVHAANAAAAERAVREHVRPPADWQSSIDAAPV